MTDKKTSLRGKQIIVREHGRGIHLYLDCMIVQNPPVNDPYIIKPYKINMKNIENRPYFICVWCKERKDKEINK